MHASVENSSTAELLQSNSQHTQSMLLQPTVVTPIAGLERLQTQYVRYQRLSEAQVTNTGTVIKAIHTRTHTHTHAHTYMHTQTHTPTHTHTHTHTYTHTHTHTHKHTHTHTHAHTHTHTCTHAHMHTHIHTHTHRLGLGDQQAPP